MWIYISQFIMHIQLACVNGFNSFYIIYISPILSSTFLVDATSQTQILLIYICILQTSPLHKLLNTYSYSH